MSKLRHFVRSETVSHTLVKSRKWCKIDVVAIQVIKRADILPIDFRYHLSDLQAFSSEIFRRPTVVPHVTRVQLTYSIARSVQDS